MIKNLSIKNKKIIIILVILALVIPFLIFLAASTVNPGNRLDKSESIPMEEIPIDKNSEAYELELIVNIPTVIPGTNIELELMSTSKQQPNCFDCLAITIVEVRKAEEVAVWDYKCGGFTGECNYQFKRFDYVIEALDLRSDSMLVKVYPDR